MGAIKSDHDDPMPLAEIALNTAIELDRPEFGATATAWMRRLASALSQSGVSDFGLVSVYSRALTSANGTVPSSKSDMYARLREFGERLSSEKKIDSHDRFVLRDFCLALHDGLLNEGFQSHYNVVDNARLQ